MAQVSSAARAGNFSAAHAVSRVVMLRHGLRVGGNHEARPAASGVELGAGVEEQRAAAGAVVVAGFVVEFERAGEGPFGALLAQDVILLGRKLRAPLGIGLDDLFEASPGKNCSC